MDGSAFDRLTRALNGAGSRRGLLGRLSVLPPLGGLLAILEPDDGAAQGRRKRRKKRHKHGKDRRRKHHKQPCKPNSTAKHCLGRGNCATACGPDQVCQGGVCGVVCGSNFCPAASEICDRDRLRCERCKVTCPSGSCQDTLVAEAVAAASAGARIYICPGRYVETDSIVISRNLTLYGAGAGDDPAFATILDGQRNTNSLVSVSSSLPTTIRNLSITRGNAIGDMSRGGGIFKGGGELTLKDVTIAQCQASDVGGGIYNHAGQLTLERTTITACTAEQSGGGIANASGGGLTLIASTVSGCTAEGAGDDDGFGGGIFNDGELNDPGVVLLDGSTVSGCSAAVGGGIFNRGALRLEHAVVSGNAADVRDGGLFSTGGVELVGATEIRGNRGTTEAAGQGVDNDRGSVTCQEAIVDPLVCGNPDDATATAASNCAGVTAASCGGVCRGDTTPGSGACPA